MQLAHRAPGRRRPRHARARHRRAGRGRLRRGVRACRTARACSATATPAGRSSSRRQALRQRGVTIKLNPLREVVRGKRLIVVDDSIVRGTTTKQIVELLRKAGATEVHVRISAPPIYHPCFYGIDTSDRDRADRGDPHVERDPRVHRRRLARLPVDPRRARGARPAVRAVLLRLLRRQLPRARAVRRRQPQVHARGARRSPVAARTPTRPARTAHAGRGRRGRRAGRRADARRTSSRRAGPRSSAASAGSAARSRSRPGYREPLLVASTDGVGTKTAIAAALGRFDTIGIDLVAMCADDVVCSGRRAARLPRLRRGRAARPGRRRRARRRRSRRAAARPAARSSAARRPSTRGSWRPTTFDLAGLLHRRRRARRALIDGSAGRAGDVDPRPGLVRPARERLLAGPGAARRSGTSTSPSRTRSGSAGRSATPRPTRCWRRAPHEAMATLGEVLLTPTRIYARAVLAAARGGRAAGARPPRPRPHHRRRPARQRAAGAAGRRWARGSTRRAGRCPRSCACSGRWAGSTTTSCGRPSTAASAWSWSCRPAAVSRPLALAGAGTRDRRPRSSARSSTAAARRRGSLRRGRRSRPSRERPDRGRRLGRRLQPAGARRRRGARRARRRDRRSSSPTGPARPSTGRRSRGSRPPLGARRRRRRRSADDPGRRRAGRRRPRRLHADRRAGGPRRVRRAGSSTPTRAAAGVPGRPRRRATRSPTASP